MLAKYDLITFVATAKPQKARDFYGNLLELHLVEDAPFALVFDAGKTMLRVSKVSECVPAPYTVLGWKVPDIRATMQELISKGITFERYAGMSQDALGIWTTPGGDKVSWFKDPDGNTLSLTQFRSK